MFAKCYDKKWYLLNGRHLFRNPLEDVPIWYNLVKHCQCTHSQLYFQIQFVTLTEYEYNSLMTFYKQSYYFSK